MRDDRPHDHAVVRLLSEAAKGVCFRLEEEDLLLPVKLPTLLDGKMRSLGVDPHSIDLLLDLRYLSWIPLSFNRTVSGGCAPGAAIAQSSRRSRGATLGKDVRVSPRRNSLTTRVASRPLERWRGCSAMGISTPTFVPSGANQQG